MSFSLINKGLELIEEDFLSSPSSKCNNKIGPKSNGRVSVSKGNRNRVKNLKHPTLKRKLEETLANRKVKSAFNSCTKNEAKDYTLTNIEALSNLDRKLSSKNVDKVKEYNLKKLAKSNDNSAKDKKKVEESNSFFTEEDFERMNEEWLKLL